MKRLFLARNGVVLYGSRMVMKLPRGVGRLATWLYWDVWWGSWLSWRLTCNPRTTYLVALGVMAVAVLVSRARIGNQP